MQKWSCNWVGWISTISPLPCQRNLLPRFLPILTLDWTVSLASKGWTLELAPSEEIASISTTTVQWQSLLPLAPYSGGDWIYSYFWIPLPSKIFCNINALNLFCGKHFGLKWPSLNGRVCLFDQWNVAWLWWSMHQQLRALNSNLHTQSIWFNRSSRVQRAQLFSTWCCSHRSQHIGCWLRCVHPSMWTAAGIDLLQPAQQL